MLHYFNRLKAPFRFRPIISASRPIRSVTVDGAVFDSGRNAGEEFAATKNGGPPFSIAT